MPESAISPAARRTKRPLPRVLAIVGPTSSGKTGLSLHAARLYNGEIINADARQIYQGCTIGTGKPPGRRGKYLGFNAYLVKAPHAYVLEQMEDQAPDAAKGKTVEIPHYLMDFLQPQNIMTVSEWCERALRAVRGITARGHLPILVGGTGLYLDALIDNFSIPQVPPNPTLRASFEAQPLEKLVALLLKLDPSAGSSVDLKNPRRVVRALEICTLTGKSVTKLKHKHAPVISAFQIGIRWPREVLNKRIDEAIDRMVEEGWPEEVRRLHEQGLSWDAPAMTSIGYREMAQYLRGDIMLDEAIRLAKVSTHQYAKRQDTWFKRDKRIHWMTSEEEALELIKKWYQEEKA